MLRTRYLNSAIAAALLLASGAHAASQPFDNVVVFGDSLSDDGNFSSKLFPSGPTMRFTTNPGEVAVERVAQHYGFNLQPSSSGGTDYAWGGALAASDTSEFGIPIPSTQHQLNDYFASTGGRADSHALYTFWIGANDLFGALDSNSPNGVAVATATAQSALNELTQLRNAGARYIVVFNIPDLSKTPDYNGTPQMTAANQLAVAYNNQLNAGIGQLGVGIIPVNTYALINEVVANPARYGFTNVTNEACNSFSSILCTPSSLVTPKAASDYLFADGVHPTTAAHAMLAQVVLSELAAPGQISLLGETELANSTAQTRAVRNEMLTDGLGGNSRVFANVNIGEQRFGGNAYSPRTASNNVNLTVGGDLRLNENFSAGVALGLGHNTANVAGGGGYDLSDAALLAYLNYQIGNGYVGAYADGGHSNYTSIDRSIRLGPAIRSESGSTSGTHDGAGLTGGWWFGGDTLKTGPFANVEFQDIRIDGYSESGNDSTSMWFGSQRRQALIGTLGWRLQGQWTLGNTPLSPFAEIDWNHDSKASPRDITTGLTSLNGSFALSGFVPDKNWGSADLGLSAQLSRNITGWFDYNGHFSDSSQKYNNFNVGLKYLF